MPLVSVSTLHSGSSANNIPPVPTVKLLAHGKAYGSRTSFQDGLVINRYVADGWSLRLGKRFADYLKAFSVVSQSLVQPIPREEER